MSDESQHPTDSYEFDPVEVEGRPRTIVAIYGGPTWHVLDEYEDVLEEIENVVGDARINLLAHQEAPQGPARIQVNPNLIATVFEITEERWKADRLARHAQEQAMREQAMRGMVPGGPPPSPLN